jgi:DNA primase
MAGKTFVDFALIKSSVRIEQVLPVLGLTMKGGDQKRSACPVCKGGGDRALAVNLTKNSFYCFAAGQGGDVIGIWAHIRSLGQREAAEEIAAQFRIGHPEVPERPSEASQSVGGGMPALDYLEHDHEAVSVIGFEPDVAEQLGIGFAAKGVLRGFVAIPIRLADGTLCGYVGATDLKLPPKWHGLNTNIVPFGKKTA